MNETHNPLWNQFLVIKNFNQYPALSSLLTGYGGQSLFGYTYVDHEEGITLEILKLFTENDGEFIIDKDLPADRSRAILRFEHFSEMDFEIAEEYLINALKAEVPGYIKGYDRDDLISFRNEKAFEKFRAPGFTDDIQILLINNRNTPELIWGRVEDYNSVEKTGTSKLLVQPHQNFNLNNGDQLKFKWMDINNSLYAVAIIDHKPAKKWWQFRQK